MKKLNILIYTLCLSCAVASLSPPLCSSNFSFAAASTEATISEPKISFANTSVKAGTPIQTILSDISADNATYSWTVGDKKISETSSSYTPTADDYEKMITVTVKAYGQTYSASLYFSELPVVYVNTENAAEITSKEEYIPASCNIQGNAQFSDISQLYSGDIKIRGRGNYTWEHPKKPYKIKLDEKSDILGMGKNKHWVLIAEYVDPTHIRNEIMPELSKALGMEYTAENQPVILVLNGEYNGLYHLSENVRIGTERVNIFDWEDTAEDIAKDVYKAEKGNGMTKDERDELEDYLVENLSWTTEKKFTWKNKTYQTTNYVELPDSIDGGYLMELDTYDYYHTAQVSDFETSGQQPIQFANPEYAKTNPEMFDYARNYIQCFENAVIAEDYYANMNGEALHYSQMFDMDSLVQYWMMLEVTANSDGMRFSNFMYKDFGELFKIGPAWDYDWTWNAGYTVPTNEWWTAQNYYNETKHWYKYLTTDPYFITQAYELYQTVKPTLANVYAESGMIDTAAERLQIPAEADLAKWQSSVNLSKEISSTKAYVKSRYQWMDSQFSSVETLAESLGYQSSDKLSISDVSASGNTVSITVSVNDTSAAEISFQLNGILVGNADVSGGKAVLNVPASALKQDASALNTVEIRMLNSEGAYIKKTSSTSNRPWGGASQTSTSKAYSNFTVFTAAELGVQNTVKGDVNADGEFNISDVIMLQKWLLAVPDIHLANWKAGDLCEDSRLDVFDLCLMKRELLKQKD